MSIHCLFWFYYVNIFQKNYILDNLSSTISKNFSSLPEIYFQAILSRSQGQECLNNLPFLLNGRHRHHPHHRRHRQLRINEVLHLLLKLVVWK